MAVGTRAHANITSPSPWPLQGAFRSSQEYQAYPASFFQAACAGLAVPCTSQRRVPLCLELASVLQTKVMFSMLVSPQVKRIPHLSSLQRSKHPPHAGCVHFVVRTRVLQASNRAAAQQAHAEQGSSLPATAPLVASYQIAESAPCHPVFHVLQTGAGFQLLVHRVPVVGTPVKFGQPLLNKFGKPLLNNVLRLSPVQLQQ